MPMKRYTVHVEDRHVCNSYEIDASSPMEAKLKAKEKFILEFYNIKNVKSSIIYTETL